MQAQLAALATQIAELVMRLNQAQSELHKQKERADAAEKKVQRLEAKLRERR